MVNLALELQVVLTSGHLCPDDWDHREFEETWTSFSPEFLRETEPDTYNFSPLVKVLIYSEVFKNRSKCMNMSGAGEPGCNKQQ